MDKSNEDIVKSLSHATDGLLFMSESDYPFELIQWEGPSEPTAEFICNVAGESEGCRVQRLEVGEFLSLGRYRRLLSALQHNLSDLRVYKVGRINMPVYVVGRNREGSWLGVATRVVET